MSGRVRIDPGLDVTQRAKGGDRVGRCRCRVASGTPVFRRYPGLDDFDLRASKLRCDGLRGEAAADQDDSEAEEAEVHRRA